MLHKDMKYIMTLKNNINQSAMKIFDYSELYCLFFNSRREEICDFLLDSSFLVYLQDEAISIVNIRKDCIDRIMRNLYVDIKDGMMDREFILYNSRGVNKFLYYCSKHKYTKNNRTNRYVIHYLTHKLNIKRR